MGKRLSTQTTRLLLLGGGAVIVVLLVTLAVVLSGGDNTTESGAVPTRSPSMQTTVDGQASSLAHSGPPPPCLDEPSCDDLISQRGCAHDLHLSDPAIPTGVVRELP
eukprot:COSAG06_NODE_349_length_16992_cov_9.318712_8_plen_107_part_00